MENKKILEFMYSDNFSNMIGEAGARSNDNKGCFLDGDNFVWKVINGEWIGKRSVWTFDFRACWLEDTVLENVKSWWCGGIDADYLEIFKRDDSYYSKN